MIKTIIALLLLSLASSINARELSDNFNINYTAKPACQISINNKDVVLLFNDNIGEITKTRTSFEVVCSNKLPFSVYHVPENKSTIWGDGYGDLIGSSANHRLGYKIFSSNIESDKPILDITKSPLYYMGNGLSQEIILEIIIYRHSYLLIPSVDKYTGSSTIRLTF